MSDDWDESPLGQIAAMGTVHAISDKPVAPRPRAFPPGFHVAAPGPSHDDLTPPPAPPRRRKKEPLK